MESKLEEYKEYFDNLFKKYDENIILDLEQRKAILSDKDNLLVIAGAGSGKTTTMVAKVVYLIEKCGYKETDIVVISFTKKVKEELQKIIHESFGYNLVSIKTFHSLGLEVIKASGFNYNKIIDEGGKYSIFNDYIKNVLFNDKEKFNELIEAFSKYLYFTKGYELFNNFNEYHNYTYNNNFKNSNLGLLKHNLNLIDKRSKYKKTIKGEYLRSIEEVKIANVLYINGIDYIYEKRYENKTHYFPDFYISQNGLSNYIEHFGVDENGHNDMFTDNELKEYLKTLKLKKEYFNSANLNDLFIVTYSKYKDKSKDYLHELVNELNKKGYVANKVKQSVIFEVLKETDKEKYTSKFINNILIQFIDTFKQLGYKEEDFDKFILNTDNDELTKQLKVLKDFFVHYQNVLREKKYIDFNDMIYKAVTLMPKIIEDNLGVDFKYLIIDEYQDISFSRLELVKTMSDLFDAKVMAVGDDFQTIFGYSGSRIDLFKNFVMEMKNADRVAIENTYRNSQELIDIAGDFILKNSEQIVKRLKSFKHLENPVVFYIYDDADKTKSAFSRANIMEKILDEIVLEKPDSKVLFMGRYTKDVYKINDPDKFKLYQSKVVSKKYPKLKIDYLTIHKAKGTGYDYCILIDLNNETYGFPSKIEDIAAIKYIKPHIDEPVDYPEERRLMYVALTRTKNKIYALVPKSKKSSFFYEVKDHDNVEVKDVI